MGTSANYHFVTRWRVEGTPEEAYRILDEPAELARWWPSVYLDVRETNDEKGQVYHALTKGWLPYTLRWSFRRTQKVPFERMSLQAWGDFVGEGHWTFRADGPAVEVTYEWTLLADKPLLRRWSWLLRPVFAANHHWAMARGEQSLRLELRRRRAANEEERQRVPAPPGPNRSSGALLALAALGAAATLAAALWWALT
jgi:hypothetical protein